MNIKNGDYYFEKAKFLYSKRRSLKFFIRKTKNYSAVIGLYELAAENYIIEKQPSKALRSYLNSTKASYLIKDYEHCNSIIEKFIHLVKVCGLKIKKQIKYLTRIHRYAFSLQLDSLIDIYLILSELYEKLSDDDNTEKYYGMAMMFMEKNHEKKRTL